MKAIVAALGALIAIPLAVSAAQAQPYYGCSPALQRPLMQAPDACGPGFYYWVYGNTIYGPMYTTYYPCYDLRPPGLPVQGFAPVPRPTGTPTAPGMPAPPTAPGMPTPPMGAGPQPQVIFPVHPYARSPRDYFMWNEAQEDRLTRSPRPVQ